VEWRSGSILRETNWQGDKEIYLPSIARVIVAVALAASSGSLSPAAHLGGPGSIEQFLVGRFFSDYIRFPLPIVIRLNSPCLLICNCVDHQRLAKWTQPCPQFREICLTPLLLSGVLHVLAWAKNTLWTRPCLSVASFSRTLGTRQIRGFPGGKVNRRSWTQRVLPSGAYSSDFAPGRIFPHRHFPPRLLSLFGYDHSTISY
jgi:hypothetical protein